jgi:TRAP-type C4-dicarboxylate transport system permease small subunit
MNRRNFWQSTDFILTKIIDWYVVVAEVAAAIIMLLSVADVVGSKFFNAGIPSATELVEQLNVPLVFGAVAFVGLERGHIRIDSLDSRLSLSANHYLKLLGRVFETLVCAFLSWRSLELVIDMIENFSRNNGTVAFPLLPFSLSVFLGFVLLAVAAIISFGRETSEWGKAGGAAPAANPVK